MRELRSIKLKRHGSCLCNAGDQKRSAMHSPIVEIGPLCIGPDNLEAISSAVAEDKYAALFYLTLHKPARHLG